MQTPTSRISAKLLDQLLITIRERLESGETIRKALCEQAGIPLDAIRAAAAQRTATTASTR